MVPSGRIVVVIDIGGNSTVCFPEGEETIRASDSWEGIHVPVNIPSPATRSGVMPSSANVTTSPPDAVTVTGPAGKLQLMLNTERGIGTPIVTEDGSFRTEKTGLFEQVIELMAFILLPVMVLFFSGSIGSPPDRRRFLMDFQSRFISCDLMSAARPVTWGVA